MHPQQPRITLTQTEDYREGYANAFQVRMSVWDFFLMFGKFQQTSPDAVDIQNFQGVYLSPSQAKALSNVLQQNIAQYEATWGEIPLEPRPTSSETVQ